MKENYESDLVLKCRTDVLSRSRLQKYECFYFLVNNFNILLDVHLCRVRCTRRSEARDMHLSSSFPIAVLNTFILIILLNKYLLRFNYRARNDDDGHNI